MLMNYMIKLPLSDKEKLAEYLESAAHDLRQAADNERRIRDAGKAVTRHRRRHHEARDVFLGLLWQGLDADRAAQATERQTGVSRDWIDLWAKQHAKTIARQKRDRDILRRAQRGWTSAELGGHFDLHPNTIDRIIAKARRMNP